MSVKLDKTVKETGTKFSIFPQPSYLEGFENPEVIHVNVHPSMMNPGPACDRIYAIDPVNKSRPYENLYLPPYEGPLNPRVTPDPDGHFDYLDPSTREYQVAHMYAVTRRGLDIWQDYFGRKIHWVFRMQYKRLELIPLINWDNAHSGWGFLEFGYGSNGYSIDYERPYCMNFDVIVHELVHNILFSEVQFPNESTETDEFWGFHEASADLGAIVVVLHSPKVVDYLLEKSCGNLFSFNELARVGELSKNGHIRNAFNWKRMSSVSRECHDLSQPLTGAIFDIFVEVFQKNLVQQGLISEELADRSFNEPGINPNTMKEIEEEFRKSYSGNHKEFKTALFEARDYLGGLLAELWQGTSPHYLYYPDIINKILTIDDRLTGGLHEGTIVECFSWREIQYSPDSPVMKNHKVSAIS